jgi:hypothetical protein
MNASAPLFFFSTWRLRRRWRIEYVSEIFILGADRWDSLIKKRSHAGVNLRFNTQNSNLRGTYSSICIFGLKHFPSTKFSDQFIHQRGKKL